MSSRYLDKDAEHALQKIVDIYKSTTGITITFSQAVEFLFRSWNGTIGEGASPSILPMNQFLIDGLTYRKVFRDVGTDHEERGGCISMQNGEFRLCDDCKLQKACPADEEAIMQDAEAREAQDVRDAHSSTDGDEDE